MCGEDLHDDLVDLGLRCWSLEVDGLHGRGSDRRRYCCCYTKIGSILQRVCANADGQIRHAMESGKPGEASADLSIRHENINTNKHTARANAMTTNAQCAVEQDSTKQNVSIQVKAQLDANNTHLAEYCTIL